METGLIIFCVALLLILGGIQSQLSEINKKIDSMQVDIDSIESRIDELYVDYYEDHPRDDVGIMK